GRQRLGTCHAAVLDPSTLRARTSASTVRHEPPVDAVADDAAGRRLAKVAADDGGVTVRKPLAKRAARGDALRLVAVGVDGQVGPRRSEERRVGKGGKARREAETYRGRQRTG